MFILNWDFDVLTITFDEINVSFLISNSNYVFMNT